MASAERDWSEYPPKTLHEDVQYLEACLEDFLDPCSTSDDHRVGESLQRLIRDWHQIKSGENHE